jgi:hypothetical protein
MRGRPPKLDGRLAAEIAALLLAGRSTTEVAQTLGISRRSISGWRRRAWSRNPEDEHCVALMEMVVRGLYAARAPMSPGLRPLEVLLADVAADVEIGLGDLGLDT